MKLHTRSPPAVMVQTAGYNFYTVSFLSIVFLIDRKKQSTKGYGGL